MGNCVSPPAPPSIPPEHPFLGSRIHSSSPGSGFAFAAASESRPSSFGMDCGTTRSLQGKSRRERASKNHQRLRSSRTLGRGGGSREKPCSRTLGRKEGAARSSPARQAAQFSTLNLNPPLSPQAARCFRSEGRRRRARQPSRSERGERAEGPKSPSEQGRRHLVVKSQVKRQSRRERESAGGLERTAFQDAFLPHPRECAGKRIFGRKSKTMEIISFNAPAQSVPVTRGQAPKARP